MTRGGPRAGAGRPLKGKDCVRDRSVRIHVTETEMEVLELLAEQWAVPVATAAYGLLADCIAHCRKKNRAMSVPDNLVYNASRIIAKYETGSRAEG